MTPKYFIGIDISKQTLDVAVLEKNVVLAQLKIENSEKAIKEMLIKLKRAHKCGVANTIICAENMGHYGNFLEKVCIKKKMKLCFESSLRIRRTLGIVRGKNDAVDAVRISQYASKHFATLKLWEPLRPVVHQLKLMVNLRKRLLKAKGLFKVNRDTETFFFAQSNKEKVMKFAAPTIAAIENVIKKLESEIKAMIREDENLNRLMKLITSIPRIGEVVATNIIVATHEFRLINSGKKFASYCGIAPFEWTSGTSIKGKKKISHIANKEIKSLLHMAAVGFTRKNYKTFLAKYYRRKVKEGKNKMSVLNAIRNKLVLRIFACVRDNKMYREPVNKRPLKA